MIRKFLTSLLLVVGLAGCNLPGIPDEGPTSAPSDDAQITGQASEATDTGTSTPNAIVPVPVSSIQIEGVPYLAYQIPGDPFRFVCQEPCPLDLDYIYAEYAGFRLAHAMLIQLTGIDTLAELQPVDMHIVLQDSICGERPWGHAYVYSDAHQAYTCTEGPGYYPTLEEMIQKAAQPEEQYFPLHEYMHTIFFGRISGKAGDFQDYYAEFLHDFVNPVPSFAIGIMDPAGFCSYRNENPPRGDYPGWLISELCQQNGFQLEDVARSLIELDLLYQSGGGQVYVEGYEHPSPTVAQYRDILNQLLGSDTTNAFAEACWPPELFGDSFSSPASCPSNETTGTATPIK
ncbi:MAG: hypothetical protein HY781_02475 [Chloroflexi bacterium]|nr:hypothetical protein [Chloroflexota bacterium]